jgi:MoaA/NifB/PqqE/SkfB family radical SAM enzyme
MNKLTTAVWEITMGCNMRCKHCGSSCAEALPDELNTSEYISYFQMSSYFHYFSQISSSNSRFICNIFSIFYAYIRSLNHL